MMVDNKTRKRDRSVRTVTDAISAGEYVPDTALNKPARCAHFLDWAAATYPRQYVPYNYVVKAIEGYGKLPRLETQEVDAMRQRLARVRDLLHRDYKRDLDTQPGVGVRATVDSADVLVTTAEKRGKRLIAAKNAFEQTVRLVDPAKLPDTPAMARHKKWFQTSLRDLLKSLPDLERRALPPAEKDGVK